MMNRNDFLVRFFSSLTQIKIFNNLKRIQFFFRIKFGKQRQKKGKKNVHFLFGYERIGQSHQNRK